MLRTLFFIILLQVSFPLAAKNIENKEIADRVEAIEQRLEHSFTLERLSQLDSLQYEVQSLIGRVDELAQQITNMKQQISALNYNKDTKSKAGVTYNEHTLYQKAQFDLRSREYDGALEKLKAYLTLYPDSKNSTEARYWLGEIYSLKWQHDNEDIKYNHAVTNYRYIVENHPKHHKAPTALFKLGILAIQAGDFAEGHQVLNQLISAYPDSDKSELAKIKIAKLTADGKI